MTPGRGRTPRRTAGAAVRTARSRRERVGQIVACLVVTIVVLGGVASAWLQVLLGEALDPGSVVTTLASGLVGAILVARRPATLVGWILCAIALLLALGQPAELWGEYRHVTTGTVDIVGLAGLWYNGWGFFAFLTLVFWLLPLVFPDGRPPSPRWRPLVWLAAVVIAGFVVLGTVPERLYAQHLRFEVDNPVGVVGVPSPEGNPWSAPFFVLMLSGVLLAFLATVGRFRRSRGVERQQLKWFLTALALFVAAVPLESLPVASLLSGVAHIALPAAVGVAVLRYRLYEIDRIISRTLTYAVITAVLVGVYVLVAVVPATLFDLESDLLAAAATLAAAAAFGPVRRRVQTQVDRRFNRSRYDALRTADAFRARLRHTVDLEDLSTDLVGTVGTTVQPAHATVWLRPTTS